MPYWTQLVLIIIIFIYICTKLKQNSSNTTQLIMCVWRHTCVYAYVCVSMYMCMYIEIMMTRYRLRSLRRANRFHMRIHRLGDVCNCTVPNIFEYVNCLGLKYGVCNRPRHHGDDHIVVPSFRRLLCRRPGLHRNQEPAQHCAFCGRLNALFFAFEAWTRLLRHQRLVLPVPSIA